ncbi:MAG TPA: nickel pincer cofactor biosynthesis protein LarC [Candidatus Baltobacteraceae bacterium]|nr:nickel pincer cofactor biosynthesis protein LarC [Candidatus Baltobacteraceae bacterium]
MSERIAYVEMIGGAAGDMLVAAWLDAGVARKPLERELRTIVPDGWSFEPKRVVKRGIAATYAGLVVPGEDGDEAHSHEHEHEHEHEQEHEHEHARSAHRTLGDVLALLDGSGLSARARERAGAVYRRLAEAEGRVHGTSAETIRFHEIGQIDAILDVAAFCVALDLLEIAELRCSPFPIGHGSIAMEHGIYPNPPPATAELLRGWPTHAVDVRGELVTTTAAAILTTLATPGGRPDMIPERIGYGAGRSDFAIPNVTRVTIGTRISGARSRGDDDAADAAAATPAHDEQLLEDEVCVVEANIDDMSPQHYELAVERLFVAGARDVWLTPITMKKGRPAITLSALGAPEDEYVLGRTMLAETTTIGVRTRRERRIVLPRRSESIDTPYGAVRVKRAGTNGSTRTRAEYDDLVRIARERELPLAQVARVVQRRIDEEEAR